MQRMTVRQVLAFIDDNLENEARIDVATLARYSGYSMRHIQRLFRDVTGMKVGEYIRRRRLTRAALLLRLTLRPLADIAFSLGFDSQQSFNREFKKLTGYAPLQYRRLPFWPFATLKKVVTCAPPNIIKSGMVHLKGGHICGQKVIAHGCIPEPSSRNEEVSFTELIFRALQEIKQPLWGIAEATPERHGQYDFRVNGCLGYPDGKTGDWFSYPAGWYFRIVFITAPETHSENIHQIYQSLLPAHDINRAPGPDILVFQHDKEKIICHLFIPVIESTAAELISQRITARQNGKSRRDESRET